MEELIKRIIPVFVIIFVGYVMKQKKIISDSGVNTLKNLMVNVFLPASLFLAFLNAEISAKYLLVIAMVIVLNILLYLIGLIFKKAEFLDSIYSAEFFTGFEFGMVGIALFSGIFGVEALSIISLIGLGHEFFIWFIYQPLLLSHSDEYNRSFKDILLAISKSPIIISIITALILNISGLAVVINKNFITSGIITAIYWFSSVTIAVVLIVLGSSLKFKNLKLLKSIKFIVTRFLIVCVVATAGYIVLNKLIPDLQNLFIYAWLTFFILPPPYIIPIYVSNKDENEFLSSTIMLYTLFSLVVFVTILFIYPPVL